jgi:hypothetical protein
LESAARDGRSDRKARVEGGGVFIRCYLAGSSNSKQEKLRVEQRGTAGRC